MRPSDRIKSIIWSGTTNGWNSNAEAVSVGRKSREITYASSGELSSGLTVSGLTQYSYNNTGLYDCVAVRMNLAAFQSAPNAYADANIDACTATTPPANSDGPDRITRTEYFADRKVKKVTSGYGVQEMVLRENTYTDNGLLKTEKDGEQNLTFHQYDPYDRLYRTYYPPLAQRANAYNASDYDEYGYDNNSNVTSWRRRDTLTITASFDGLNQQKTKTVPAADTSDVSHGYAYYYDNAGHMVSASEGGRTITRAYDGFGRLQSETGPIGTLAYHYDTGSRRDLMTWPDGFSVSYKYDNTDALTYICRASAACDSVASEKVAGFAYDNLGRRKSITRGDATVTTATTTYAYDPTNLLLQSISQTTANSADNVLYSFTYNPVGQVKTRSISNEAYVWRPSSAPDRPYSVDGLNRITDSGAKPVSPQTTREGFTTFAYDGRGNLKCVGSRSDLDPCVSPSVSTTYLFDGENRLRGTAAGASLVYDPLGRLYQSIAVDQTVTRYLYDGSNLIGEYAISATVPMRRYVFSLGADEPLARYINGDTTLEWLLADHQGSIIAVLSATGAVTSKNTYDEYGVPGPGNIGLFQYTGQVYLSNLDLYHYKARAYSPTLGRFLQTDPTGYDDGLNWYAYVGNDPINRIDPLGLADEVGSVTVPSCPSNYVCSASDIGRVTQHLVEDARAKIDNVVDEITITAKKKPPANTCPGGKVADFARGAREFGSAMQSAGDWTAVAGAGTAALGAAGLQPEVVLAGGAGVTVGKGVSAVGFFVQIAAGAYLYMKGDSAPLTSTVVGQVVGKLLPPALPGNDPAGDIGDAVAHASNGAIKCK